MLVPFDLAHLQVQSVTKIVSLNKSQQPIADPMVSAAHQFSTVHPQCLIELQHTHHRGNRA